MDYNHHRITLQRYFKNWIWLGNSMGWIMGWFFNNVLETELDPLVVCGYSSLVSMHSILCKQHSAKMPLHHFKIRVLSPLHSHYNTGYLNQKHILQITGCFRLHEWKKNTSIDQKNEFIRYCYNMMVHNLLAFYMLISS